MSTKCCSFTLELAARQLHQHRGARAVPCGRGAPCWPRRGRVGHRARGRRSPSRLGRAPAGASILRRGRLGSRAILAIWLVHVVVSRVRVGGQPPRMEGGVLAFWLAYVLTRPLGASYADWMGEPRAKGGLEWGGGTVERHHVRRDHRARRVPGEDAHRRADRARRVKRRVLPATSRRPRA